MIKPIGILKDKCAGCGACYNVCPVNAITMEENQEGFLYPEINGEKCFECKKCQSVCPVKNTNQNSVPLAIYGCKNSNENIRINSSSGGVFSLIAEYVENNKGVIYGAAFDKDFSVKHQRGETFEIWNAFSQSKYVQSDIGDVYNLVKKDLDNENMVLFSGTPCQVEGLKRVVYNHKNKDNLITCDIICHGVPSPKVWKDYLEDVKKTYKKQIGSINFRDKEKVGWHESTLTIKDKSDNIILKEKHSQNVYSKMFFNHWTMRPSCFSCPYANFNRTGDITLGDFWGIEKHFLEFDDNKGVSLIMCNTEKGKKIFSEISILTEKFEVQKEQCVQPNLVNPSTPSDFRKQFWNTYKKWGYKYTTQILGLTKRGIVVNSYLYLKRKLK